MDIMAMLDDFYKQSLRVINVTHKPSRAEYEHIAKSTALGIAAIGAIGFIITLIWRLAPGLR
jgi:protein translocase SEC61 complex gamma subunit